MSAVAAIREAAPPPRASAVTERTRVLLEHPILPTLLRLSWPNVLVMLVQSSSGLVETWWIGHLGVEALAGMALVFPAVMLMTMLSAGSIGGAVSSAVARALGRGSREDADALVMHALVINGAMGAAISVVMLIWGRPLYAALGGTGASLDAAVAYSNVVFVGNVVLWLANGLASVIRGTGNIIVPALANLVGVLVLLPLSPLLIFGLGPIPALGVAGGGLALVIFYAGSAAYLAWYVMSGRNLARLRRAKLRWTFTADILKVGSLGALNSVQTNLVIALATALVGHAAGPDAIAGFGTGARLEYLLIPVVFGLGAPLVPLVGTNIGAGQRERALRIAWTGAALAFVITETIGIAAALFPEAWLRLFGTAPEMLAAGSAYLRWVGPFYGFFGVGLALNFASQGAGKLLFPVLANLLRLVVSIGGGWVALTLTGSITWLFAAMGFALLVYGAGISISIAAGVWFRGKRA